MDKFIKYIEKQGIQKHEKHDKYDTCISYEVQTCGHKTYFMEAPNFIYKRVCISFDYNVEAGEEYFKHLKMIEKKILAYAKKYGYIAETYCYTFGIFIYVTNAEDAETAEYYYHYMKSCIRQWEEVDHHLHTVGKTQYSNLAAEILNRIYSLRYRQFLRAIAK